MPIPLSETAGVLCILLIALIPLAIVGVALVNTGMGRSPSAAHTMLASLGAFATATCVYCLCGYAWQGYIGIPGHTLSVVNLGGKPWGWIGAGPFFLRGVAFGLTAPSLALLLQVLAVGLAAIIPLGAGIDRWKLSASCASTALLAGLTYPLFAHWVWGGGWLAQLGINAGMGHGFIDAGGTSTVQMVGGLTALSMAWILGPRRGKYSHDGMPTAIPGHNAILIMLGCMLALLGWVGLNSAGAILFTGAEPGRAVQVAINTVLSAAAAGLTAGVTTRIRFGRPDVSITANGWVGGLVAGSAACAFIVPVEAVAIGLIAGVLVTLSVEWFELYFRVDDPGGAVSAHAVAGLWGLLAVAIFARFPHPVLNVPVDLNAPVPAVALLTDKNQWVAQLAGIATLLGFVLPLTYGVNLALNLILPQRVPPEAESQGLDLYELGAGAYPEFVVHTEEFTDR